MSDDRVTAYPLTWPPHWKRTSAPERYKHNFKTTIAKARDAIADEVWRMGGTNVVISTNAELNRYGQLSSRQRRIDDVGVAVYFDLGKKATCVPCDRWDSLEDNLQAIAKTIEALRGIERWGSHGAVEAAFAGYAALPSTIEVPWWSTLGLEQSAGEAEIKARFKELALKYHPDTGTEGGDVDTFQQLMKARDAGLRR